MTRDEAKLYAKANIDRICAEQGVTVKILDPTLIAISINLLRIGKRNLDAIRLEVPPAAPRR